MFSPVVLTPVGSKLTVAHIQSQVRTLAASSPQLRKGGLLSSMVSRIPSYFTSLAVGAEVAEGDLHILKEAGITTADRLYFQLPS